MVFSKRILLFSILLSIMVILVEYWLQILIIFVMIHVLMSSERLIEQSSGNIENGNKIPISSQTFMILYGFGNIICSYVCIHVLFISFDTYVCLVDAIISSLLISLFVFLLIGAMKQIAVSFRFFRNCDIENGALGLLTSMAILIRFVFVAPVWVCFLNNTLFSEFPNQISIVTKIYLFGKFIGFLILCFDFSRSTIQFFNSVLLRVPKGKECLNCKSNESSIVMAQCGHYFCLNCLERSRKVSAKCPLCDHPIPRKWTIRYKSGSIPFEELFCIL